MHHRFEDIDALVTTPHRALLEQQGAREAWDVILAVRRTQRRLEVATDQAVSGYGVSFAQHLALRLIERNPSTSATPHVASGSRARPRIGCTRSSPSPASWRERLRGMWSTSRSPTWA
jgi:hypothetical protein